LVVVGKSGTSYKVVLVQDWRPPVGGRVDIEEIENAILHAHKRYNLAKIACDPWNCAQLVERLKRQHVPIVEQPQSGANLVKQCKSLLEAFTSHSIRIYDHPALTSDLRGLRVEEKAYGCRLISDAGTGGHGDRASALSIALAVAHDMLAQAGVWGGVIDNATIRPIPDWAARFDDRPNYLLPRGGMPWMGKIPGSS
jgi:hypothetical protein